MTIAYFDPAREELEDAVRYYERKRAGLGDEFAEEVQKVLDGSHCGAAWDRGRPGRGRSPQSY